MYEHDGDNLEHNALCDFYPIHPSTSRRVVWVVSEVYTFCKRGMSYGRMVYRFFDSSGEARTIYHFVLRADCYDLFGIDVGHGGYEFGS